jgi:murein DD-endopeptidase / murein LD-carboxypeptidase
MPVKTVDEIVRKYLGVPFRHGGRDMDGADCWGLVMMIYADLGFKLWDVDKVYDEGWTWKEKSLFIENYHRQWERVEKPQVFDGVLFCNHSGVANHCGVMLENGRFIQSTRRTGVIVAQIDIPMATHRFEGYYRYRGEK